MLTGPPTGQDGAAGELLLLHMDSATKKVTLKSAGQAVQVRPL